MKQYGKKFELVLGLAILTQVGCNAGQRQQGQYLYPNVATQQQDHNLAGDAFGQSQGGGAPNGFSNFLSTVARGATNPNGTSTLPPVDQGQGQGQGQGSTTTPASKDAGTNEQASTPITFKVSMGEEPLWIAACKELGGDPETGDDTDGDGITDDCEKKLSETLDMSKRMIALDPKVFNGAVISTKRYYKEKAGLFGNKKAENSEDSLLLTDDENKAWKTSKDLGGFGSGVDSKFDRQVTKKFLALATQSGSDMKGLKQLFAIDQKAVKEKMGENFKANFEVIDENQAAKRGKDIGFESIDPKYGLVRADHMETIPFSLSDDGSAVASLSGIAANVNSLRQDSEFIYIAETHLVVPAGGIELRIGNLMSDRTQAMAGSKSGMFFVMNGNNSVIVSSDLIENSNKNGEDLRKSRGTISTPSRCKTAHIVIAYFADSKKVGEMMDRKAIFAENVFYKDKNSDEWKLIPQEWLRLKSMDRTGKSTCDLKDEDILFSDVASNLKESTPMPSAQK